MKTILKEIFKITLNAIKKGWYVMPRLQPTQRAVEPEVQAGPLEVQVADAADDATVRVVTLRIKKNVELPAENPRNAQGVEAVAICDLTGEPIYKEKNVNVIESDRPELNGKVVSTRVMKALFALQEEN